MTKRNVKMASYDEQPVLKAVLQNAVPAIAAMIMVLIYNLADTFFIAQTKNDYMIAAVSLATPAFLIFMSLGTLFDDGGTSVISRAMGEDEQSTRRRFAHSACGHV